MLIVDMIIYTSTWHSLHTHAHSSKPAPHSRRQRLIHASRLDNLLPVLNILWLFFFLFFYFVFIIFPLPWFCFTFAQRASHSDESCMCARLLKFMMTPCYWTTTATVTAKRQQRKPAKTVNFFDVRSFLCVLCFFFCFMSLLLLMTLGEDQKPLIAHFFFLLSFSLNLLYRFTHLLRHITQMGKMVKCTNFGYFRNCLGLNCRSRPF